MTIVIIIIIIIIILIIIIVKKCIIVAHFQNKCYYYLTDVTVIWAGGRTEPPLDKPRCGWENELCLEQERQGKFLGKMYKKKLSLLSISWGAFCISVESGTTAVRQRITLKYSFHLSRGQTSEAFSFDLRFDFKSTLHT